MGHLVDLNESETVECVSVNSLDDRVRPSTQPKYASRRKKKKFTKQTESITKFRISLRLFDILQSGAIM